MKRPVFVLTSYRCNYKYLLFRYISPPCFFHTGRLQVGPVTKQHVPQNDRRWRQPI